MLCPLGILLVLVYRQSSTSLIGEPQGRRGGGRPRVSHYTRLGPQVLGPRRSSSTPGEVVQTCIRSCLSAWERLDVHTELFVYMGALLGPRGRWPRTLIIYTTLFFLCILRKRLSTFSSYKCLGTQSRPCRKKDQRSTYGHHLNKIDT